MRAKTSAAKPKSQWSRGIEEQVFVLLQRTADRLAGQVGDLLKSRGLSPTQYNALRILRGAGEEGLSCSEVSERMINRDPDITRLVDRLGRRGLVTRSRGQRDRRVIMARITPAGMDLLQALDRPVQEFNRRLLGHMGERRLRSMARLLNAALKHCESHIEERP
jgi:DNA-binding MarR family transcriptional regulator